MFKLVDKWDFIRSTRIMITISLLILSACGDKQIKTPSSEIYKFEQFKRKEKFNEDQSILYPGISAQSLKPLLTENINHIADDFYTLAVKNYATEKNYQDKIEIGLKRFSLIYENLDTEDRERICAYIQELMDIVGLENSGGHLNNFIYGFEPTK